MRIDDGETDPERASPFFGELTGERPSILATVLDWHEVTNTSEGCDPASLLTANFADSKNRDVARRDDVEEPYDVSATTRFTRTHTSQGAILRGTQRRTG